MKTFAGRKLSRPTGARKALLRNMAASLLKHEQVKTTLAKAREVSRFTERVLSMAKKKELPASRWVGSEISDKKIRQKIYDVLVPRYQSRSGGCTRIHRIAPRVGDNADMAVIKLIS